MSHDEHDTLTPRPGDSGAYMSVAEVKAMMRRRDEIHQQLPPKYAALDEELEWHETTVGEMTAVLAQLRERNLCVPQWKKLLLKIALKPIYGVYGFLIGERGLAKKVMEPIPLSGDDIPKPKKKKQ